MLVDLRPGGPCHLSPPMLIGSGGGLSAATRAGDDDRGPNPEGESASAPPPADCSDPGPFILCLLAEPGPAKRTLSSPLKIRMDLYYSTDQIFGRKI